MAYCREHLGDPTSWREPPGYPDGLAICVLDCIWSLGARYQDHVVPVLNRYRAHRKEAGANPGTDSLGDLRQVAHRLGGDQGLAELLDNRQRTSTHSGAPLKAEAVLIAAERLLDVGVDTADDFRHAVSTRPEVVHTAWRATPGQRSSDTGWRYLQVLTGADEVKPDRMVCRFVAKALDVPSVRPRQAAPLVVLAAQVLAVRPRTLDHAIWRYQSGALRT